MKKTPVTVHGSFLGQGIRVPVGERKHRFALVRGRKPSAHRTSERSASEVAALLRQVDLTTTPGWKSVVSHYGEARPFKLDADPALVTATERGRFSGSARMLFSVDRTNMFGMNVRVSGYAPARFDGEIDRDGRVTFNAFDVILEN